jgi:hypothetical protein
VIVSLICAGCNGLAVIRKWCPGIALKPRPANSTGTQPPRTGIPVRGPNREFVIRGPRTGDVKHTVCENGFRVAIRKQDYVLHKSSAGVYKCP